MPCLLLAWASFFPNHFLLQHSCCNCGMEKSPQGLSRRGPGQWVWLVPVGDRQVFTGIYIPECWDLQPGLLGAGRGSTATDTRVSANHSRGLAWSQLPGLLDIPLLTAALWPPGETGTGLPGAFQPRSTLKPLARAQVSCLLTGGLLR